MVDDAKRRLAALSDDKRRLLARRLIERRRTTSAGGIPSRSGDVDKFPLSYAQHRIWFLHQLDPSTSAFNIPISHVLKGQLNVPILERSLNEILRRHESLRTVFEVEDGVAVQRILTDARLELPVVDLRGLSESQLQPELLRRSTELYVQEWQLDRQPPVRARLYRTRDDEHVILIITHHVVSDGWSTGVLVRELGTLYEAFQQGQPSPLPELPFQYADYAVWQWERLQGPFSIRLRDYWLSQLEGISTLNLPTDAVSPLDQFNYGTHKVLVLSGGLTQAVRSLGQQEQVTLFMTLLAALATLLFRYTGQTDIVIGSPVANRNRADIEPLIGCFMNPLPFRVDLGGEPTFRELLARVRKVALGAYEHQDLPFDSIVKAIQPTRDTRNTPVFQVLLLHQNFTRQAPQMSGLTTGAFLEEELLELDGKEWKGGVSYPVALEIQEIGPCIYGTLEYADGYTTALSRLPGHLRTLLEQVVVDPDRPVTRVDILPAAERHDVLTAWNDTRRDHPSAVCVHELFARQAAETPDAVAVVEPPTHARDGEINLTYRELNRRANRLAHYLRSLGVGPETRVGVCLDRSVEMLTTALGVLKAGAAYVPLDATHSSQRLQFMLDDARAAMLLTTSQRTGDFAQGVAPVIVLDQLGDQLSSHSCQDPPRLAWPANLAYIIYTSGSTGRPKGAAVQHRSLANAYHAWHRAYRLDQLDCHLQMASFSFDVFAGDMVRALGSGARLVLCPRAVLLDAAQLYRNLREQRVDCAEFVPVVIRALMEYVAESGQSLEFLKLAIVGSDSWYGNEYEQLRRLCGPAARVVNSYGVAESTIDTCYFEAGDGHPLPDHGRVPIGRPFDNMRMYVLDADQQPCPIGVAGELHVGGAGLARGYLDRPPLTAERFVPDSSSGRTGQRLYRTGDRARFLEDGQVEFLGRLDQQVKIRGFRVELGEIEAVLCEHPSVARAVVVARKDKANDNYLVSYVVPATAMPKDKDMESELRGYLRRRLPEYMLPTVVPLEELPLNRHGKVDRAALPTPERRRLLEHAFVTPQTETQTRIADLWREVLEIEKVGLHDNFFDLGGHSLQVIQLHSKLRKTFHCELAVVDLFRFPTVAALAELLADVSGQTDSMHQRFAARIVAVQRRAERQREASAAGEPLAIIGMDGRFPGAANLDAFWRNLLEGRESITFFSAAELESLGVPPAVRRHPQFVGAKGVLNDVEQFDASFFGYSPKEAELLDPQHRVFLECGWHALENAGYDPHRYSGSIGVFAGSAANTYLMSNLLGRPEALQVFGADKDFLCSRLSYHLNLSGPSVAIQTACSTSLVAVCQACQSLQDYHCDMALAGGVCISVPVKSGYWHQEGGVFSPDGHCRAFDARGRGFVGGNGVGLVVLKRLADALADGDKIEAVIKGFAVNNDGSEKIGYTAPSVDRQAEVIAAAQAAARVDARTIGYVEAHGTATELGDPIEIKALTQAFRAHTADHGFCAIGSVKTNIGHLDTAAGIAGLIKAALAVRNGQIPASLHFEQPNPQIDFARIPFYVNTETKPWVGSGAPRRAGVSSFGIGGTNAHVILEQAPEPQPTAPSPQQWQVLPLSAQTDEALQTATKNLAAHLEHAPPADLADVAYTLQVGRRAMPHRRVVVSRKVEDAVAVLDGSEPNRIFSGVHGKQDRSVVFLFPGQGAQYVQMAAELYGGQPVFTEAVDECVELLQPHLGMDLRELIYPGGGSTDEATERLTRTSVAQPALFVVEYALARMWMAWNVQPAAFLGHSIGEYVAACLAGVLSLPDSLKLVSLRGRLMESMPPGVMLAVPLAEAEIRRRLGDGLWLAAVNGPSMCVVSGGEPMVSELERALGEEGIEGFRLRTSHAFHSGLMDEAVEPFADAVRDLERRSPRIPYISNVTGDWITEQQVFDPEYWSRQIRQPVRFADGLDRLLARGNQVLCEVGPGQTLATLVRQRLRGQSEPVVLSTLPAARDATDAWQATLSALGRMWASGVPVDWEALYSSPRRRVALPTYPFTRQRYWVEPIPLGSSAAHPTGKLPNVDDWIYVPAWTRAPVATEQDLAEQPEAEGPWLVFLDNRGCGRTIVDQLQSAGRTVVTVVPGERFERLGEDQFSVAANRAADYTLLMQRLEALSKIPAIVLHLWGVDSPPSHDDPRIASDHARQRVPESLLVLTQARAQADSPLPLRIVVVTSGVHEIVGGESLSPETAAVTGLARVIPQEYPGWSCKCIDISSSEWRADSESPTDLAGPLMYEAIRGGTDSTIGYRGGYRWVQDYRPLPLARVKGTPSRLRSEGVYWITGGLGDIGLKMAEYLAETVRARLILSGRSGLPPEVQWETILHTADQSDATAERIRRVQRLKELGAEVVVLCADVSDARQMQESLNEAKEHFGTLHGLIHAAGLVSPDQFRPISQTDQQLCAQHLGPKLDALYVLADLLHEQNLDFCLLVSSLSTVLGGLGYAAYASANAAMDAFAYSQNQRHPVPWITVNWDSWLRAEDEARMRQAGEPVTGFLMTAAEGLGALDRVLSYDIGPQIAVSSGDLAARIEQWVNMGALQEAVGEKPDGTLRHPRPTLQTEYVAPTNASERAIADVWQSLLGIDGIGIDDSFFELGGDSLMGLQLIARMNQKLTARVSAVSLFEAPTVRSMARLIDTRDAEPSEAIERSRSRGAKRRDRRQRRVAPATLAGDQADAGIE